MDYRRTFALHDWREYGLTIDLFAHELGHNRDREHTFEDPDYPYETFDLCGARRHRGFGVRSSFMPQCGYSNDQDIGIPWIDPHERLLPPTMLDPCAWGPDGNLGN